MNQINFLPPKFNKSIKNKSLNNNKSYRFVFNFIKKINSLEIVILTIIIIAIIFVALFGWQTIDSVRRAYKIKSYIPEMTEDFSNRDFAKLKSDALEVDSQIKLLEKDLEWLSKLKFIPILGKTITRAKVNVSTIDDLSNLYLPILEVLQNSEDPDNITPAQKKEIISIISENSSLLKNSKSDFENNKLSLFPDSYTKLTKLISVVADLSTSLPRLLGVEGEAHYLVLFVNNLEIRPAGGFIGSYAIVTVKDGDIADVTVRDSYSLYNALDPNFGLEAPLAMKKYLNVEKMHFRDSNWSPDFPTSVSQILQTYSLEQGQSALDLDGVFAVSTEILKEVLNLTGPVTIDGVEFNEKNAISQLQYEVDVAVWLKNIPYNERKDIVGHLAEELNNKIDEFNFQENLDLLKKVSDLALQKHIVFNFMDESAQAFVLEKDVAGFFPTYESDTLAIIDSNFLGGKTENLIQKLYSYKVRERDGKLVANLDITYKHLGYPNPLSMDYRSYLRVFVPKGSRIILSSAQLVDFSSTSELGRDVFAGLVNIPIGKTQTISLVYELPQTITDKNYSLSFIKQIGSYDADLLIDIQFGNIKKVIEDKLRTDKTY